MARATTFKYTVTVVNPGSGNKYYLDGILIPYITLFPGCTYEFNQDDSSNATHPLRFATQADAAGSSEYTTGVTTTGTPGSATAWTKIEVTSSTPFVLYFYCTNHSGMGGEINIPPNMTIPGDRALQAGGESPSTSNIDYLTISTTGNATKFGDLIVASFDGINCVGGTTRAFFGGGAQPGGWSDRVMAVNFASKGNCCDWNNLTEARRDVTATGNSIKGIYAGGSNPSNNVINTIQQFIQSSLGNCVDFGDLTTTIKKAAPSQSPTRGLIGGGETPSSSAVIDYITFTTQGNASDFGDLAAATESLGGNSNSTRGLFGGGYVSPAITNTITYVTIASTGNSTDFGDLTQARQALNGASNTTRCVFMGGQAPSTVNTIDYVTIGSTGNATDFGDLTYTTTAGGGGNSNGHGGLA